MLRVVVVGLGPIGLACAQAVRTERDMDLVGLIDIDPAKRGRTLSQLSQEAGKGALAGVPAGKSNPLVTDAIASVAGLADVAILSTASSVTAVTPAIAELLRHKIAVVSSCERLSWPWYRHAEAGRQIDEMAKTAGRAVLGTGVNPGFVMDTLAVVLSTMVRRVASVRCERRVDAALRRQPLQAKVGATMTVARFEQLKAQEKIGHEGLPESIAMLAAGLGRTVTPGSITITLDPVIADKPTQSALGLIQPGQVTGIHNTGRWSGDGLTIELDLTMAVGCPEPRDAITIDGPVPLRLVIPGGTPGDSATVAAMVNHLPIVHAAPAGLRTMIDVPPAGCRGRDH